MIERVRAGEWGDHRGFILPLTLLAVLALSALALAAWTLAAAEHQGVGWERRWLAGAAGPHTRPGPGAEAHRVVRRLPGGYRVVTAPDTPGLHHLAWCLDPSAEAREGWLPDAASAPPLVGPIPAPAWAGVGGLHALASGETLPAVGVGDSVRVTVAPGTPLPAVRVDPAGAGVLLIAPGSVELTPLRAPAGDPLREVVLSGAFVIAGDLALAPGVQLIGGVRLGGALLGGSLMSGTLFGTHAGPPDSPPLIAHEGTRRAALALLPTCPDLVHLLGRLGRF